jgi:hypothetical protein
MSMKSYNLEASIQFSVSESMRLATIATGGRMKTYPHIRRALAGKLWYVHEQKMNEMLAFLEFKLAGGSTAHEVLDASARPTREIGDGVECTPNLRH